MIKIPLEAGHHPPASKTPAFRWRPDDGLTLISGLVALRFFKGSVPVLLRKPIFVNFQGGRGLDPLSTPPLDPPMPVKKFSAMLGRILG